MRIRGWWLAAVLVAGCGHNPTPGHHPPGRQLGEARRGRLIAIAEYYLVVERAEGDALVHEVIDPRSGKRKRVPLPDLPGCARTTYDTGFAMSAYELGVRRECVRADGSRTASVVAYHLRHGKVRVVLARSPDADAYVRLHDRDLLAWFHEGHCTWLQRYRPGRRDPRPLNLELLGDGWPLDAVPPQPGACREHGMVKLLAGRGRLAFVASPAARGLVGAARDEAPYWVYKDTYNGMRAVAELPGRPLALEWHAGDILVSLEGRRSGVFQLDGSARPQPGLRPVVGVVAGSLAGGRHNIVLTEHRDGDEAAPIYELAMPYV